MTHFSQHIPVIKQRMDTQYCTCFLSPWWHLQFWGGYKIF